jgi:hypothetical protein
MDEWVRVADRYLGWHWDGWHWVTGDGWVRVAGDDKWGILWYISSKGRISWVKIRYSFSIQ